MEQPNRPRFRRWLSRKRTWFVVLIALYLMLFLGWYLLFPYRLWMRLGIALGVVTIAVAINYVVVSRLSRKRTWFVVLIAHLLTLFLGWFLFWSITNPPLPAGLGNKTWELQAVQSVGGSGLWTPNNPRSFYLKFSDNGLEGGVACNDLTGGYSLIRFTNYLSIWAFHTLVNCPPFGMSKSDAQRFQQEQDEFLRALDSATNYELRGDELYIYFDNAAKVLTFTSEAQPGLQGANSKDKRDRKSALPRRRAL